MIKTEHDNVLTLYCQDKKIVTNGKLLRVELGLPYQIMSFRYVGKNSKEYTRGNFYNVIDCSPHWYTNEIVVFVTDNEYPETTDADYCTPFSFDIFLSDFEYDSKYLELMNKTDNLEDHLLPYSKAMVQKIIDEKMQLVTADEFLKLHKEYLTAIRENCKLQEQLNTAKKYIEHVIGTIKHDGHLGTIQTDLILPDLEKALAAIGNEGSGDE